MSVRLCGMDFSRIEWPTFKSMCGKSKSIEIGYFVLKHRLDEGEIIERLKLKLCLLSYLANCGFLCILS